MPSSDAPFDEFVRQRGSAPRRGVFGMLVHDLGRRIVGGEFPPCSTLPNEEALGDRFRVSRTVFREAMKALASKGLVEIRPKTGTKVRDRALWHHTDPDVMVWHYEAGPSAEMLAALRDLRRVLEPAAAARAAAHATPAEIDRIAAAYDDMCTTIGDPHAHSAADQRFHAGIFEATHNFLLARMIDVITIGIYGNAFGAKSRIVPGQEMSLPYHLAVLDAIRARDPAGAADAANRLLDTWHPLPDRMKKAEEV